MRRGISPLPLETGEASGSLLDVRLTVDDFAQLCRGRWLPSQTDGPLCSPQEQQQQGDLTAAAVQQQQQHQQTAATAQQQHYRDLPQVLFEIVATFDAAIPSAREQQKTLEAIGLWAPIQEAECSSNTENILDREKARESAISSAEASMMQSETNGSGQEEAEAGNLQRVRVFLRIHLDSAKP